MSQLFAREGAGWSVRRDPDLVNETVAMIRSAGGQAVAVVADAAREEGAQAIVEAGRQAFGGVDTLVNNAGDGGPTKPIQDYSTDEWFYTMNSCLTSAYLCSRFAVPAMIAAGRGAIVNIASMAGRRGLAYRVGYCSAKAGQIGMTYGLALELGRHNITVNAIAPGAVAGDRIDRVIQGQADVRGIIGRADARVVRRPRAAAADVDGRRHRGAGGIPLQRARAQHLGAVHSGHGRRTGVMNDPAI